MLTSVSQILNAYPEDPTFAATDVTNNDDVGFQKACKRTMAIDDSGDIGECETSPIDDNFVPRSAVSDILKECNDALNIHISAEMTFESISDISTDFQSISNDHDGTGAFSVELINLMEEPNVDFSLVPPEEEMGIISTPNAADHSNNGSNEASKEGRSKETRS